MIEVLAKLKGGPSFFAGEKIICSVLFQSSEGDDKSNSNGPNSRETKEILGWASAQVVCICSINPQKVVDCVNTTSNNTSSSALNVFRNSTSLSPSRGEHGCVIFSSSPKILVCDLTLTPGGNSKEYLYEETLPFDIPSSFRGQAVKYSYKIKIGLQRVGAPIKMLHLPFRLMTMQSLGLATDCKEEEEITISNPFLKVSPKDSLFSHAHEVMQLLSSRRSPSVYKVTNSQGKVVNLCLFKTLYRLGEDIIGTLDFDDASVSCMQYSVTLQSQEIIPEEKRRRVNNQSTCNEESMITSYSKHHEFSVGLLQTHLSLSVPLHVTPSFSTEMVSLKWRLHFEFVTTNKAISWKAEECSTDKEWQPPRDVSIETMVWDFPITVYCSFFPGLTIGGRTETASIRL